MTSVTSICNSMIIDPLHSAYDGCGSIAQTLLDKVKAIFAACKQKFEQFINWMFPRSTTFSFRFVSREDLHREAPRA